MLREIRDLGFEYAELSHGIRLGLIPGILEAVDAGEIKISSLHNFCPLPMGVNHASPNLYEFSDERPREREWRSNTRSKRSSSPGGQVPAVVLHLGSMDLKDYTGKLTGMLERDGIKSSRYEKLRAEAAASREAKKGKALERVCETLRHILPEAKNAALSSASKTARRSKKFRLKATLNFSSTSLTARTWFIGTTPATRKSRKISDSFITHSILNRSPRAWPDFTFTTLFFLRATTLPPVPARSTSPRSNHS